MQNEASCKHNHDCHTGFCFVKWGLWFFIIGVILGFGVLIHYLVGSSYDNTPYFLSNITLWFGSPLALSTGFLQVGGLAMALIGGLCIMVSKCAEASAMGSTAHCPTHKGAPLALCIIGLFALILTGYLGYFVIDYFWPGFYYTPIMAGKNLWLILQGLSIIVYIIGIIIETNCLAKCKRCVVSNTTRP